MTFGGVEPIVDVLWIWSNGMELVEIEHAIWILDCYNGQRPGVVNIPVLWK